MLENVQKDEITEEFNGERKCLWV